MASWLTRPAAPPLAILAGTLLDGTLSAPRRDTVIAIDGGRITGVRPAGDRPGPGELLDLSDFTVLPGLINMHTHTVLPGDGTPFEEWMLLPDELLLLRAHANGLAAIHSGVTTLRDCGGKGSLMFRLREAIAMGLAPGPRFVLCGRPLTITGGHCRYFGGEVDGVDGMRRGARELLNEGADFIKIMAAGGGTIGAYAQFPSYETEELAAAIAEAHKVRKPASCHCLATESIVRALDAGADHIEHCGFMAPDTNLQYDEAVAQRVADAGVYVTATLQVMADTAAAREAIARGDAPGGQASRDKTRPDLIGDYLSNIRNLHELGVPIVAGSDAGWRYTGFDDFFQELVYLQRAGLSSLEAIHAATGRAAAACQLDRVVGTIAPGLGADLIAVKGDPLADLNVLRSPAVVIQGGRIVVDRRD